MKISVLHLRYISLVEGVSYLLLVFIGMPLKYAFAAPLPNKILGMTHGVLTIIFCLILAIIVKEKMLSKRLCAGVFIASLIPFGAFIADKKLKHYS